MRRRVAPTALVIVSALACLATTALIASAMWKPGERVPVERLIKNTRNYVAAHPKDAKGHYVLARAHSLAFAEGLSEVPLAPGKPGDVPLPDFHPDRTIRVTIRNVSHAASATGREHLAQSLEHYARATELAPDNGLYWLGYGWMLEQASRFDDAPSSQPSTGPATSRASAPALPARAEALDRALVAYQTAHDVSRAADLQRNHFGPKRDDFISLEAMTCRYKLLQAMEQTDEMRMRVEQAFKALSALYSHPASRSITPVIFPMSGATEVRDLLGPTEHTVAFDLAGDDVPRRWPWVTPDTGILCWDPDRTGKITSGRQLFGSATWWMFFEDGYQALAALDDDADGQLTGRELAGIAVWRDANSNGVSDAGEVQPLASHGITTVAARATTTIDGVPLSEIGVRFSDGRTAPTFDWMPRSVLGTSGR